MVFWPIIYYKVIYINYIKKKKNPLNRLITRVKRLLDMNQI